MKERGIEEFLKNLQAPAPDPQARLRAKRTALAEFERAQAANDVKLPVEAGARAGAFQALWRRLRLSRGHTSHGSRAMKWYMNRGFQAGAAGLAVVAIGLSWVLPNLAKYDEELRRPAVAQSAPVEPALDDVGSQGSLQGLTAEAIPEPPSTASRPAPPDAQALREQRARYEEGVRREAEAQAQFENERAKALGVTQPQDPTEVEDRASLANASPPAPPPASAAPAPGKGEQIIVTGVRARMYAAQEAKRGTVGMADASQADAYVSVPPYHEEGRDQFAHFDVNPVQRVADAPVSTFSADVDTASYSFMRAALRAGALPPKDSVRAEEMINYFDYAWPAAESRRQPFKPTVVVSDSPWGKGRKLVHIGIKGYELRGERPDANLVLLLDVSGSMNEPNKLPLAVRSMELLLDSLKPSDTVGIVVYAGAAGTVLEPTPVRDQEKIVAALRSLRPGGATAGAAGIQLAYDMAEASFRRGGVNRILLATDGDFNVGVAGTDALKGLVERKREKGVYLSVLGFGQGNYRDELAQALAQNGNGVAAYIDTENEARKVLVQEASGSLFTIAKDVKLQVEFNPATVSEYRLVGYETRALRREDFNNDAIDAGDVGAGHTVTAIYEVTPVGAEVQSVDEPRYQGNRREVEKRAVPRGSRNEYGFLKMRYKLPGESESRLLSEPIPAANSRPPAAVARDVAFSTAVAGFAQLLRGGAYTGTLSYGDVIREAQAAKGEDRFGYRAEFIDLVRRAQEAD